MSNSDESNSSQIGSKSGAGAKCDKPFVLDYNEAMRVAASIESTISVFYDLEKGIGCRHV